jgi:hypothetical protein
MTGPLTISGLGTWKGSRIKLDYVTANSESSILKIGTPENEENLRVYKDKVKISSVPLLLKTIHGFASGYGTYYEGAYTEPNHIATKKDVDAAFRSGGYALKEVDELVTNTTKSLQEQTARIAELERTVAELQKKAKEKAVEKV